MRKLGELCVDEKAKQLAEERGLDVNEELEAFNDYCLANGRDKGRGAYKNFNAAFRNYIRLAPKFGRGREPVTGRIRRDVIEGIKRNKMFWRSLEGMSDTQINERLKGWYSLSEAEIKELRK